MDLDLASNAEKLAEKAQQYEAFSGINLRHVRGEVSEALVHFGRLGLLEEYTKHDMSHIDAMLAMYDWMVPESTKSLMTPADWLLVTLTTYLHDFGLLVTRDEFDARDEVTEFVSFRRRIIDTDDPTVKDYRSQIKHLEAHRAEEFLYQEFVRASHAQRIRGWLYDVPDGTWGVDSRIAERLRQMLGPIEETFREDVGLVCESHHLDDINDTKKYPLSKPYGRTESEEANVQYAAFLLRTADLLHITKDRVPSMAALVINPRNPKSQVEWAKQSAVRSVRPRAVPKIPDNPEDSPPPDAIEVHATFKEAEGFFGLTSYLQYAAKQVAQTFAWSKENQATGGSEYVFPWRRIDVSHIEAKGFVAEPFEFTIDQGKILDLLTGHTLYNDTGVVVRELVQNALDAVRLKQHLSDSSYSPRIDVTWDPRERIISVVDNGVGMSQDIIEQNFLRVGSSRYQDPQFQKEHPDFAPISRFGIGVLSTFMVADDVSVSTNHELDKQARKLSLRDVHGQYLVRLLDKQDDELPAAIRKHGTAVRLKLRPSAQLTAVPDILKHWVLFPGCDLWLTVDAQDPVKVGYDSVESALEANLVESNIARRTDEGLKTLYGSPVEVRTVESDSLEIAFAVSWNRWLEEWGYLRFNPDRERMNEETDVRFGLAVGGIRVTTTPPGFVSGGIVAMANAFGKGAPRTNVARSALEKTEEYDALLANVYGAYVSHIGAEMEALEKSRAASLTRAAQEASYMAEDIARAEAESPEIRNREFRNIPAIIVEEAGQRRALSFRDIESWSEVSTIESTTISSFENVLRSVRGASGASLRNLLDSLGSDQKLPDSPLICGLSRHGLLSRMFTSEWEVVRLETDVEARTLRAVWHRRGDAPRWQSAGRRNALPSSVAMRIEREAAVGRGTADLSLILLPRSEDIDTAGFDRRLVACQGRLLVLPGYPLLDIEASSDDVPSSAREWCIAWLISATTDSAGTARGRAGALFHPGHAEERQASKWMSRVLEHARELGLLEVLDEESLGAALHQADLEVLDVNRWDQRQPETRL
jgi:molecular chaperone HtpG